MMRHYFGTTLRITIGLMISLLACFSHAASYDWNPGATPAGTWDTTTSNWYDSATLLNTAWINGSDAVFGAGILPNTYTTGDVITIGAGGVTAQNITFNLNGYLINGDTLTLTAAPLYTSTITANSNATISSVIADVGSIGLTKAGGGTLTLASTGSGNTYTGNTTISAGTLAYNNTNQLGSLTNRIVFNGGTLKPTTSGITEARGIDMISTGTINTVNGTSVNAITLSGGITGTGNLNINGPGAVTLSNNSGVDSTYTGTVYLTQASGPGIMPAGSIYDAGLLNFGASTNAILGSGATIATQDGGRAQYTRINNTSGAPLTLPGVNFNLRKNSLVFLGANNLTFGGDLLLPTSYDPSIGIQILNNATLGFNRIFNNRNSFKTLDINSGTIAVGTGGILLSSSPSAARGMAFRGSSNMTVAGPIVNGGTYADTVEWASTGTLTMSGANTYTGWTAVRAGQVILDHTTVDSAKLSSTSPLHMAGSATIELRGGAGNETVSALNLNTNAVGANGRDIAGGTTSIIRTGGATGVINLNTIARSSGGSAAGTGTALNIGAPSIATTDNLNNATGILGGWATVIDGLGNAQWAINSTGAADAPITDYSGYAGTWNSTDNTAITGSYGPLSVATTVNTLRIGTSGAGQSLDLGGNTLSLAGSGLLFAGADNYEIKNGKITGQAAGGSEVIANAAGAGTLTLSSVIANNGTNATNLTKTGPGTVFINALNTYTGTTYVGQGTLKLGTSTAVGTSGPLGNGNGALWVNSVVDLNGQNLTSAYVNGSFGTITNNSAIQSTLTFGQGNANMYNSNLRISGNTKVIKTGTGYWDAGATNNDFTGGLIIDGTGAYGGGTASSFDSCSSISPKAIVGNTTLGTGTVTLNAGRIWMYDYNGEVNNTFANNFIISNNQWNNFKLDNNSIYLSGNFTGASDAKLTVRGKGYATAVLSGDWSGYNGTLYIGNNGGATAVTLLNTASELANGTLNFSQTDATEYDYQSQLTADATIQIGSLAGTATGAVIRNSGLSGTTTTFKIGNLGGNTTYAGHINNGSGITALTKVGSGTLTLSGTSNFTGATIINGGTLNLGSTAQLSGTSSVTINSAGKLYLSNGSLLNSAASVQVNSGGMLGGIGTIGGAATIAGGVDSASRGIIDLTDNLYGNLNFSSSLNLGDAVNPAGLKFEVGASANDTISVSTVFNPGAAGARVSIVNNGLIDTSYTLMTYPTQVSTPKFLFDNGSNVMYFGFEQATLTPGLSSLTMSVVNTGGPTPADAYWTGSVGTTWDSLVSSNVNFTVSPGGANTHAFPGSGTTVHFISSGANFTNSLGAGNLSINGLRFEGNPATVISGTGRQLSIDYGGITLDSTSGGATLAMSQIALANYQIWTNKSSNPLNVSAAINSSGNPCGLSFDGPGVIVLSGANTYAGTNTITPVSKVKLSGAGTLGDASNYLTVDGTLDLGGVSASVGDISGAGSVTNSNSATTSTFTVNSGASFAGTISNGPGTVALIKNSTGSLVLPNANPYSGGTSINGGSVQIGNGGSLGSGPVTIANLATLDLNGQTINNTLFVEGSGVVFNSSTTPARNNSPLVALSGNVTLDATNDISIAAFQTNAYRTITKTGTGTLTFSSNLWPSYGGGDQRNTIVANEGTVVLAMDDATAADTVTIGTTSTPATVKLDPSHIVTTGDWYGQVNATYNVVNGTLDLNGATAGHNGYMQQLIGDVLGVVTNSSTTPAVITIRARDNNTTRTFNGVIQNGAGEVGINYEWSLGSGRINELTGINTYTGATNNYYGTLKLTGDGSIYNSQSLYLASGTTLDVSATYVNYSTGSGKAGAGQTIYGTGTILGNFTHGQGVLTPGTSSTAGTLTVNGNFTLNGGIINYNTGTTSDLISVTSPNSLTLGGAVTLNVDTGLGYTPGASYTVIDTAGGVSGSAAWTATWDRRGTVPTVSTTATQVLVTMPTTFTAGNLNWAATASPSNVWDVLGTTNWYNTGTSSADKYYSGDNVTFGDKYNGVNVPSATAVTLNTNVAPSSMTFSNSALDYTISGTGQITGTTGLVKNGSGKLTLNTKHTYTGDTVVNGGTLVLTTGGGGSGAIRSALTVNSGATVSLTYVDALGYNAGQQVPTVTLNGGTIDNAFAGNQGYRTNFVLAGGHMTSTGGGKYNFTTGYGVTTNASATTSTVSSGIVVRDNSSMNFNVAQGTTASGVDLSVSGVIEGAGGGITKSGAGVMELTASATYTGNTTVNSGTLKAPDINTPAATVTVAGTSGASLVVKSLRAKSLVIGSAAAASTGTITAVPEPSTWAMLILAAMGLGIFYRRSR